MRKKLLCVALATTMVAGLLAGCNTSSGNSTADNSSDNSGDTTENSGNAGGDSEITGEITVLTNRTDILNTDLARYAEEFQAKYPGTTVNFEAMEDYEGDVSTRLSTGDYGDVFFIPNTIPTNELADFCEP